MPGSEALSMLRWLGARHKRLGADFEPGAPGRFVLDAGIPERVSHGSRTALELSAS
jgi:hypothetical protein